MKRTFLQLIFLFLISCSYDEVEVVETKSQEASLLKIDLMADNITYTTTINNNNITNTTDIPYVDQEIRIKDIQYSNKATSDVRIGDTVELYQSPFNITITAENGATTNSYDLTLKRGERPNDNVLLFNHSTSSNCKIYSTLSFDLLLVENNTWNAGKLNFFEQCIYTYVDSEVSLIGWQWEYPNDAYGVNAYPEIIYGWKPWFSESTNTQLPIKIDDINKIKVNYETEIEVDEGDYNLTFDNWITETNNVSPSSILFEFLITEDIQNLSPFGDYLEDVFTTNGVYEFYIGEPDWEPDGLNWTIVAFLRKSKRRSGEVDVDELLSHLVMRGIVSKNNYLASIEFGNEVGNSKGSTIIKKFKVEIN